MEHVHKGRFIENRTPKGNGLDQNEVCLDLKQTPNIARLRVFNEDRSEICHVQLWQKNSEGFEARNLFDKRKEVNELAVDFAGCFQVRKLKPLQALERRKVNAFQVSRPIESQSDAIRKLLGAALCREADIAEMDMGCVPCVHVEVGQVEVLVVKTWRIREDLNCLLPAFI